VKNLESSGGGDPGKTIIWLEQQDLIEIRPAEPESET